MVERRNRTMTFEFDFRRKLLVVLMDLPQYEDDERDDQNHDPGALDELGDHLDDGNDSGSDAADAVERGLPFPPRSSRAQPVHHHPELGQREADEDPNRVEGDERVGLAAKDPDEDRGDQTKRDDAGRKAQPTAPRG